MSSLADNLINSVVTSLSSAMISNSLIILLFLDRDQLLTTNDEYDYISLTSGREKTQYGDYAAVLSITIEEREKLVGFTTYNSLIITLDTDVYEGSTYSYSFSKTKSIEALFSSSGPWRTINLLLKSNKDNIVEPHLVAAKDHAKEDIDHLVCKEINSIITVNNGKIEVPLGKKTWNKVIFIGCNKR